MRRSVLETLRWLLILISVAAVLGIWTEPSGGWAALMFVLLTLTAIPAAMLSLHLHPPKIVETLDRRRRRRQ